MRFLPIATSLAIALLGSTGAQADEYPSKPIRMIEPGPPGNSSDIYGRYFAEKLGAMLHQSIIVENKPGGNGYIGALAVTQAPADGYSLFVGGSSPMAMNPALFKNMPYDPVKDFRWVSGMFKGTAVVVVRNDSPYKTVGDLIAAGKQKPGGLNFGSYAAAYRLSTEWLNQQGGFKAADIEYKGAPQVLTDLMGGRLDYSMIDIVAVAPLVKGGKLRALAVSGNARNALLPQTPTIVESGLPKYVQYAWVGMAVKAGTPDPVVKKLTDAMLKIMASKEAQDFSAQQGADLMPLDGDTMHRFQISEIDKYERIGAAAGIQKE